jgi:hypothetical protein
VSMRIALSNTRTVKAGCLTANSTPNEFYHCIVNRGFGSTRLGALKLPVATVNNGSRPVSDAAPVRIGRQPAQNPTHVTSISLLHTGRSGLCNIAVSQHAFNFNQHTSSRPHRVSAAEVTVLTILVASFGLAWLASMFGLDQGTTISVTRLTIEIIAICAASGAIATFVDLLIGSREEKVESAIARMKRAQPKLWIARLAYTTIFAGIWCALSTHLCLAMLVQYYPGNTYSIQGKIVATSVNPGWFVCKDDATVMFDEGGSRNTLTLCYLSGFLSTRPMAQGHIEPGAMVNVMFVRNALGVAMVEMARINK